MSLALNAATSVDPPHNGGERTGNEKPEMLADSIASGLSFMLVTNVLQRGIGFLRNIAFCHFLTEQDLGLWALASGFFILAAPLSVLGLPGSLGRFAEFYRTRNQLTSYLGWIVFGSALGLLSFSLLLVVQPSWSGEVIFGSQQSTATMAMLAATLALVTSFNFLTELLGGLRQNRVVSSMQMVNSISFTILSVLWLLLYKDWRGVLVAFGIAAFIGAVPGLLSLRTRCMVAFGDQQYLKPSSMWSRVLPFAVSIWLMNLLSNLFDVVDRYMLLYLASPDSSSHSAMGAAIVGQYHSGRILPVLISSLAMMLNGMILPHWSATWESGQQDDVKRLARSTFKMMILFFWGLSIAGMAVSPMVFESLLHGRYADGLSIMPLALVHCIYAALAACLYNYFWCEEKGSVVTRLLAMGLAANIALNYLFVPQWQVYGAMLATFLAGSAVLAMTIAIVSRHGCWIGYQAILMSVLPITLIFSTTLSMFVFTAVIITISRTDWLLNTAEKRSIDEHIVPLLERLGFSPTRHCFKQ